MRELMQAQMQWFRVFVHIKMTAEGLDTESMHMVTIKNGKYASFQPFEDSAAMMKAAK